MDIKEIRNKPLSELNHLLGELRKKMDDLKFKVYQNQLKKDIAKILTIISEKNKE